MPFHLKTTESPAQGLRRLCGDRIAAAQKYLLQGGGPAAIHAARKEIKKLRAIMRLVRREMGRGRYRKLIKPLRKAAAQLAAPRDARAMLKAFRELTESDPPRFAGIEKTLRRHCRREIHRFRKHAAVMVSQRMLRKTSRRLEGLKLKGDGWTAIKFGLQRCHERGRAASRRARLDPSAEHFHEWRKHVKDLEYYFRLPSPAGSAATSHRPVQLALLGKQLGDDHDLFLLQPFVAAHCSGEPGEIKALKGLIAARQRQLRTAALKLGRRLYAGTSAVLAGQLTQVWHAGRGEGRRKLKKALR